MAALDQLQAMNEYEIVGILDRCKKTPILDVPVLGGDELIEPLFQAGVKYCFIAIGTNRLREKLAEKMEKIGFQQVRVISRHAVVSTHANVEDGTLIMPGAIVNAGARIGKGCILNTNCSVDHECILEDYVHIAPGCAISGKTIIGRRSFIGTGARIIDGIVIGSDVMLGAGAVVIKNLPADCTAVGVPAKIIK